MSEFSTLVHGDLQEVSEIVDRRALSDSEVSAVLLNLIRRVQRMERTVFAPATPTVQLRSYIHGGTAGDPHQ